jgi:protein-S-isoprenylcysteine O-methyltransferase Ste14
VARDRAQQMNRRTPEKPSRESANSSTAVFGRMRQVVVTYLVLAAILFVTSGRLNWSWAWALLGVGLGILVVNAIVLPPELIAERGQPGENVKRWDRVFTTLAGLPTLAVPIVSGLDERLGWSPQLAPVVHLLGLMLFLLGQGLFSWAMASNRYFSTAVRIQMDRGHTVASGGPYRYVRHPGYAGFVVSFLGMALALGSLWAIIPAGLIACFTVMRTALEDQTLQEALSGYKEYAQRVRHRLVPGVW